MWENLKAIKDFLGIESSEDAIIKKSKNKTEKETAKDTQKETEKKVEKDAEKTVKKATEATVKSVKKYTSVVEKEVENQTKKVGVSLVNKLKETLGIFGGNNAIRDEVGALIPAGIASGIEENSKDTVKAFNQLFASIEYQRKMDIINDEEYYTALESLRDRYFAKGSDKWLYYTAEIYEYQKKMLEQEKKRYEETYDEIFEYTSDKIEAVIKKQQEYEEKLQSYGRIFQKNTIRLDDEEDIEFYSLGDLKTQNEQLERYASLMLDAKKFVKESGLSDEAVSELLKDISSLPVHSASTALEALIRSPLSKSWLSEYEKRVQLSKNSSGLYYEDEFNEALDESSAYMKEKLTEAGYEIPETFFDAGRDSAIKFGEGFSLELSAELEKIKGQIADFSSRIEIDVTRNDSAENTKTGDEINTTNYYITAQLKEDVANIIKRYETIKRLGGY